MWQIHVTALSDDSDIGYAWTLLCSGLGTYVWYFHLWYCDLGVGNILAREQRIFLCNRQR